MSSDPLELPQAATFTIDSPPAVDDDPECQTLTLSAVASGANATGVFPTSPTTVAVLSDVVGAATDIV